MFKDFLLSAYQEDERVTKRFLTCRIEGRTWKGRSVGRYGFAHGTKPKAGLGHT